MECLYGRWSPNTHKSTDHQPIMPTGVWFLGKKGMLERQLEENIENW